MKATSSGRRPLWKHQRAALKAIRSGFKAGDRCRFYAVPGAGKTTIFLTLARDYERICVLAPTRQLVRKTLTDLHTRYPESRDISTLAVCSQGTIERDDDADALPIGETTSADVIRAHMDGDGPRIIVGTYRSSPAIRDANVHLDLIVFDEAHHCAQKRANDETRAAESLVRDTKTRASKRLFVTATPRVYSPQAYGDGHVVTSMDDESVFGPVVYEFPYPQALASGDMVVKPFVLHVAHWVKAPDDDWNDARHFAAVGALGKVRMEHDASHVFAFANSINSSRHLIGIARGGLPDPLVQHVDCYEWTPDERASLLNDCFQWEPQAFISSVGVFAEGIDTPCVDCVIFADPTDSKSAVVQKVGRALRFDRDKPDAVAHVIVPMVYDVEGHYTAESMDLVKTVLGSLAELDECFGDEIKSAARRAASPRISNLDASDVPISFDIADVVARIAVTTYSMGDFDWWRRYDDLVAYVHTHGRHPDGKTRGLGTWCRYQRDRYDRDALQPLSDDQIVALEAIPGWVWRKHKHGSPQTLVCKGCGREFTVGGPTGKAGGTGREYKFHSRKCFDDYRKRGWSERKAETCKNGHDLSLPGARYETGTRGCRLCAILRAQKHKAKVA